MNIEREIGYSPEAMVSSVGMMPFTACAFTVSLFCSRKE